MTVEFFVEHPGHMFILRTKYINSNICRSRNSTLQKSQKLHANMHINTVYFL